MTIRRTNRYSGYSRSKLVPGDYPPDDQTGGGTAPRRKGKTFAQAMKDPSLRRPHGPETPEARGERRKRLKDTLGGNLNPKPQQDSTQIDSEGLDTLVEAYISSNVRLAFVIAEALKTMVVARPGGATDVKKLDPKTGKTTRTRTITDPKRAERIRRAAEKRVKGARTFGEKPNGEEFSFVHVPKRKQPE